MLNNVLLMTLGAALAAIGVLASALADRVRGLRVANTRATEAPRRPTAVSQPREVVVEAELVSSPPPRRSVRATDPGADDVIAALVGAGYKKAIVTEAVWACGRAERETVESWTAAALRRCARGMAS